MDNRLQHLAELSASVPGTVGRQQKQAQAAQDIQFQDALRGAPQTADVGGIAAQQTATQGAIGLQGRQQAAQQQGVLATTGLQVQQQNIQADLQRQQMAQQQELASQANQQSVELARQELATKKDITENDIRSAKAVQQFGLDRDNSLMMASIKQREDLSKLGRDVEGKLIGDRLTFERDELGRKFSNERQFADYIASNSRTQEEFMDRMQQMDQVHKEKINMLEALNNSMINDLRRASAMSEAERDFESEKRIAATQAKIAKKIQKEKAAAANRNSMFTQAGTIAGAVVGGVIGFKAGGVGAAPGAVAGAKVGGALGSGLAGATA